MQDHGQGITPEVLEKLGTPFVSTKEAGTGLGLSVCSAAARHQAIIDVNTAPRGTLLRYASKRSDQMRRKGIMT